MTLIRSDWSYKKGEFGPRHQGCVCAVRVRTRGEDAHLHAKEGEASGGTNPADARISDLQLPGRDPWAAWLGCLTFRSGSARHFVIVVTTK